MLETIQNTIRAAVADGSAMSYVALAVAVVALATVRSMYRTLTR